MSDLKELRAAFGERFDCAPSLRLESQERLSKLQFDAMTQRLDRIEEVIERLEKRLWLTVYGVVGVILAEASTSIIDKLP